MTTQDLIGLDISRCTDSLCPIAAFCARYVQKVIDAKVTGRVVPVTDFEGRYNRYRGLACKHFINKELI
jgi:hypothetical protein